MTLFTGIIEDVGKVVHAGANALSVETRLDAIHPGDSVAVNGICLTVHSVHQRGLSARVSFDFSPETAARTTIGDLRAGWPVNIERAVRADGRFGGHLMSGHVECTACLRERTRRRKSHLFTFSSVPALTRYIAPRGSIAVDGISLTVVESKEEMFSVSVIPSTLQRTNLRGMTAGRRVNIEPDPLARYAERLLSASRAGGSITEEKLQRYGFVE